MTTAQETTKIQPLTARGAATRAKLIEAAESVFGDFGFDEASVSELTRRAGVSQGTFYLYFSSKQEIFSELVRQFSRDLRAWTSKSIEDCNTRAEIERAGFEAFFSFISEHPAMYRIVRQAEFVDREAFRYYYEVFAEAYAEGLSQAVDSGEMRDLDTEVMAWCLMGMGDLVGVNWILLKQGEVPSQVIDTMMEIIRAGIFTDE